MLEMSVGFGKAERFVLGEEQRLTRGEESTPMKLDAWVEITRPLVTHLTLDLIGEDAELKAFHEVEKGKYRYDYVSLACSFGPTESVPFSKAWVEVGLEPCGEGEEPMVWSAAPREIVDTGKLSKTAKIGGKLEFVNSEAGQTLESQTKEWFLRVFRERTIHPYWEFRPTGSSPITGSWPLHLIVRSPEGSVVKGSVTLRVVAQKRTFLIFRKDEPFGTPATVAFTTEPARVSSAGEGRARS